MAREVSFFPPRHADGRSSQIRDPALTPKGEGQASALLEDTVRPPPYLLTLRIIRKLAYMPYFVVNNNNIPQCCEMYAQRTAFQACFSLHVKGSRFMAACGPGGGGVVQIMQRAVAPGPRRA